MRISDWSSDGCSSDRRPRADLGGGRDRAARIRNLVALAIRPEAPGVIRAADRIAFDGAVLRHIRRAVACEMRAHVRAIRIEQDHLAAILAAIQREVLAEEAHALRARKSTRLHSRLYSAHRMPSS